MDGSGTLDVVVADTGGPTVSVYYNDGASSFTEQIVTTASECALGVPPPRGKSFFSQRAPTDVLPLRFTRPT